MITFLYIGLVFLWVLASVVDPIGERPWMFPSVMAFHVLLGASVTVGGWSLYPKERRPWIVTRVLLLAIPPLSTILFCHVCAERSRRSAAGRSVEDPLGLDLVATSRFWFGTANLGVVISVFWLFSAFSTYQAPLPGISFHPWLDPLVSFRDAPNILLRVAFLAVSVWFGYLLHRTLQLLRAARVTPIATDGESAAGDVVY